MRAFPKGLTLLGLVMLVSATSQADVYTIQIENLVPGGPETGQPMTPSVGVVHGPGYTLWMPGGMATAGLELQAEEGSAGQVWGCGHGCLCLPWVDHGEVHAHPRASPPRRRRSKCGVRPRPASDGHPLWARISGSH